MKKIYLVFAVFLCTAIGFSQGVTTSSINGRVLDNENIPLFGANIVAVHTSSGSTYGAITDFDGFYRISNMRVGGPYKITISYVGFENSEYNDVYLQLGDSKKIRVELGESFNALEEVIVIGQTNSIFDSGKTGAETNVSQRQVNNLPSISRNISDFARLTPQAKVTGDDVISISGQNNRFNAIFIDGAVNNDVFGLAANGTNGGQTGVSPISLDAIESFQINVAPFDVRQSGFAGGSINAITKSGTNSIEGSVYGFLRNQSLTGKTPAGLVGSDGKRSKLEDFTAKTYGVRVGGPLIEDKLFYFVNYERQENETPQPFNIDNYDGNATAADLDNLANLLKANYGYDAGGYTNNTSSLVSDKLIAKVDWNINENNKLSLKHSYVKAVELDAPSSNGGSINFFNGAINLESITNSTALELNTKIGQNMANNLVIGYTSVNDDRDPNGAGFPSVQISDVAGTSINFGSEAFSTANLLEQSNLTITDNFEIYAGRHNITIGTNNEFSSSKNVFFRQNFGDYRFSNLSDFMGGNPANRYRYGYSLLGGFGDDSQGAAEFDLFQFGLYVQDQVNVTDNFKFTMGVRIDVPFWADGLDNQDFNTRSVALLEAAGKDLQGARVGQGIDANVHFAPRVGFNWDVNGDRSTQIRGGLGVFTSRIPLVWPGGAYNNNGITAGYIQLTGNNVPAFNPDPQGQFADPAPGSGSVGGQIDLYAKDFKMPQVFKTNIAIDQKLPGGVVFSADFIWNDNITAVAFENLNLAGPQFNTTGPGSRPNYGFAKVDRTYSDVYLGYNTGEGSSYNVSGTLTKSFFGPMIDIRTQATYSYGDSDVLIDATSSQNSSQWRNLETVNGSNRPVLSRSDFSPGHRVIANSTIELKWSDNLKTRIGIFYEGAEGSPFSYIYNTSSLLSDTGSFSSLIYVPSSFSDALLVDTNDLTAVEQYATLSAFIDGNDYLRSRKGKFAERNADRSDWSHIIDLKVAQEFGLMFGKKRHIIEVTADIFNFTNLLNKEWGVRTFANYNQVGLFDFEGFAADGTTPQFSFDPRSTETTNIIDDSGLQSSRWQMQLGLRYSFN
ncbi:hypothetical protein KCTC52924_01571 [Arenibacter antarcticus]|uniref:Carboxypeptidase regulatory-like domain-containing protein n=1 Tax=Arenibacter antarcticus TaxID=2040469 RepID=A0ABW5VJ32_9FLAO|nr:carboxypeptidase regulatory-like domain-containing protein [Arenibacter sp. H213]MCM4166721.1 TonB-dependent receptor [Arenibacter sp. H213]